MSQPAPEPSTLASNIRASLTRISEQTDSELAERDAMTKEAFSVLSGSQSRLTSEEWLALQNLCQLVLGRPLT